MDVTRFSPESPDNPAGKGFGVTTACAGCERAARHADACLTAWLRPRLPVHQPQSTPSGLPAPGQLTTPAPLPLSTHPRTLLQPPRLWRSRAWQWASPVPAWLADATPRAATTSSFGAPPGMGAGWAWRRVRGVGQGSRGAEGWGWACGAQGWGRVRCGVRRCAGRRAGGARGLQTSAKHLLAPLLAPPLQPRRCEPQPVLGRRLHRQRRLRPAVWARHGGAAGGG